MELIFNNKLTINIHNADCLTILKSLPDNSIDACVTDPPYGWSFMSKKWDYDVPSVETWKELLRVLKPGAHILVACGTRTQHRMAVNIEDAGFEVRDIISWLYGSGFPKSHNVSKAIDKAAGAERKVVGYQKLTGNARHKGKMSHIHSAISEGGDKHIKGINLTEPATDEAKEWDGWGTALKPSQELFTLARKPLSEKTIAANVLKWGTGAINIDDCRIPTADDLSAVSKGKSYHDALFEHGARPTIPYQNHESKKIDSTKGLGRWPANLIHDGSDEVEEVFPDAPSGGNVKKHSLAKSEYQFISGVKEYNNFESHNDSGSASRFFYCAKVSKAERNIGLDDIANNHPTVKPVSLMRYLIRLITPPRGTVIDPYFGSGTTGMAAVLENVNCIGIELEPDYCIIAERRIKAVIDNPTAFINKEKPKEKPKKKPKKNKLF